MLPQLLSFPMLSVNSHFKESLMYMRERFVLTKHGQEISKDFLQATLLSVLLFINKHFKNELPQPFQVETSDNKALSRNHNPAVSH